MIWMRVCVLGHGACTERCNLNFSSGSKMLWVSYMKELAINHTCTGKGNCLFAEKYLLLYQINSNAGETGFLFIITCLSIDAGMLSSSLWTNPGYHQG